jgi:hypothetical protein
VDTKVNVATCPCDTSHATVEASVNVRLGEYAEGMDVVPEKTKLADGILPEDAACPSVERFLDKLI